MGKKVHDNEFGISPEAYASVRTLLYSAASVSTIALVACAVALFMLCSRVNTINSNLDSDIKHFRGVVSSAWRDIGNMQQRMPYEWREGRVRDARQIGAQCQCNDRNLCPEGTPGKDGEDGADGTPGEPGPPGQDGPKGNIPPVQIDTKANCRICDAGLPGPIGPTGKPGPQGRAGEPGRDGNPGPIGEGGPIGQPGDPGEYGGEGIAGPDGRPGTPGTLGSKGEAGIPGDAGPVGPQGRKGDSGRNGISGKEGSRGSSGPGGAKGEDGAPGSAGQPGPPGQQGNDGKYCEICPPRGSVGNNGAASGGGTFNWQGTDAPRTPTTGGAAPIGGTGSTDYRDGVQSTTKGTAYTPGPVTTTQFKTAATQGDTTFGTTPQEYRAGASQSGSGFAPPVTTSGFAPPRSGVSARPEYKSRGFLGLLRDRAIQQ